MTETVTETPAALVVRPQPQVELLRQVGYWLSLAESKEDTEKTRGAAGALRIYYAQDLGLPAVAAAELSMIYGKLQVSARLLRALARQKGYDVQRVDSTEDSCTAVLYDRDGRELGRTTYTLEMAQKAGIVREKSAWKTYPGRMCWARASAWAIYDFAPEVALGLIVEEEADDVVGTAGDYVDVPSTEVTDEDARTALVEMCEQLDKNPDTPTPEPHQSWWAYAQARSTEDYQREIDKLDAEELVELRQKVSDEAVPF